MGADRYCGNPMMIAIPPENDMAMLILKLTATHASATPGDMLQQVSYAAVAYL